MLRVYGQKHTITQLEAYTQTYIEKYRLNRRKNWRVWGIMSNLTPKLKSSSQALPRYRRSDEGVAFTLQGRDIALLQDLARYRLLTTSQLFLIRNGDMENRLRFVSRLPLTRRLKLLFHNGYVQRIPRPLAQGSQEPVYVLDKEGAKALTRKHTGNKAQTIKAPSPSQLPKALALEHLLLINQVRLSLEVGATLRTASTHNSPQITAELGEWHGSDKAKFSLLSEPRSGEKQRKLTLIPDGLAVLRQRRTTADNKLQTQRHFCFIEVDTGSESQRVLGDKCRLYVRYWQEGGFAGDYHLPPQVGFRVLFVLHSPKRLETFLDAVQELPAGKSLFRAALEEHITPTHIFEPIWKDATGQAHNLL
jgi:hypothetical protein